MTRRKLGKLRLLPAADILYKRASVLEDTSLRRIHKIGKIAFQYQTFRLHVGIGDGNCREQGAAIGMEAVFKQLVLSRYLYQLSEIHDSDFIRNKFDDCQVMGNKNIGEAVFIL